MDAGPRVEQADRTEPNSSAVCWEIAVTFVGAGVARNEGTFGRCEWTNAVIFQGGLGLAFGNGLWPAEPILIGGVPVVIRRRRPTYGNTRGGA